MSMDKEVDTFVDNTLTLAEETGTKLLLKPNVHLSNCFGLAMSDEGGFTGMVFTPRMWDVVKARMDKFLEEQYKAGKLTRPM